MGFGVLEVRHGPRVLAHFPPQVLLPAGLWGEVERGSTAVPSPVGLLQLGKVHLYFAIRNLGLVLGLRCPQSS